MCAWGLEWESKIFISINK
jgi:hypothetical protein